MGMLRSISRIAHAEAWQARNRLRRLRRLTAQVLRAKHMGDTRTMVRLAHVLKKLEGAGVLESTPKGSEETGGNPLDPVVFSKGGPKTATDEETE